MDPSGLIWQANADRWSLMQIGEDEDLDHFRRRRRKEGELDQEIAKFYEFLRRETATGNISRQVTFFR